MNHYSITVPGDKESLRRAAEFFAGLCGCLVEPKPIQDTGTHEVPLTIKERFLSAKEIAEAFNVPESLINPSPALKEDENTAFKEHLLRATADFCAEQVIKEIGDDPAAIFSSQSSSGGPLPGFGDQPVLTMPEAMESGGFVEPVPPLTVTEAFKNANTALQSFGNVVAPIFNTVELADGIPWDERIHSGSKKKLQSPPHGWKLKKQPQEYVTKDLWLAYVAGVEAELRAAIAPAASVASPIPPPAAAVQDAQVAIGQIHPGTVTGVPTPPAPVGLTYAGLTELICKAGIQPPQVQQALEACELSSYPALMKSSELIPRMAQLLGLVQP